MAYSLWKTVASLIIAGSACGASADGISSLQNFVRDVKSGRADFNQTVTAPARAGEVPRVKTSTGNFAFRRPDRFRFDYQKPFVQMLVADGKTLWLYDQDLNQVTARDQAAALGSTPAALIASASDLSDLKKHFTLQSEPARDGLEWVLAKPRGTDGQLQSVRVGFQGDQLVALEILDSFGQRSVMRFTYIPNDPDVPVAAFKFTPPPGADVLRP